MVIFICCFCRCMPVIQKSGSIDLAYKFYITEDENNFEENFQKLDIHLFYGTSIFQDRHIKVIISFRCTMGLSTMRLEVRDEASARFFEAMIDGGRCCR